MLGGIFAVVIGPSIQNEDSWSLAVVLGSFLVSLFGFFARGWARLRKENAVRPVMRTDAERFRRLLIGPPVAAAIWFAATILVVLGLALASGLGFIA
ncbi:hypothetical protein [Lysobacter panacisoli]|nr:hypothetical protein [Lysobacter panacisoli]